MGHQEVARAAGGVVGIRHLSARRSLVEGWVLRIAAAVRAEAIGAATGNAAAARAAAACSATAAGDPFRQSAAGPAVAATVAAAAAFAAVDVAAGELAVAGVLAEEFANRPAGVASDQRTRCAAVGGDVAAIAATHKSRLGAAASQQA